MQYMTEHEETQVFQKIKKRRKQQDIDAWNKEAKPWKQAQKEKHKRKYDNLNNVV